MAFYDRAPGKKKKVSYGELGSWDEEGTHYRNVGNKTVSGPRSGKKASGSEAAGSRSRGTGSQRKQGTADSGRSSSGRDRTQHRGGDRKETSFRRTGDTGRERTGRRMEKDAKRTSFFRDVPEAEENRVDFRDFEYRGKPDAEREPAREEPDNILCGRNPIREALKNDRDIEKLLVQKGELSGSAREIVAMAREKKIMIQEVEKSRLDEITLHHQGLIAFASAYSYATVEDMLAEADRRGEAPFLILLDSVTDPHNLGAIIRTAECVGAHGVIVPLHRSVGLTPAAVKASAGAIEHMLVARVTNLNRTIDELKSRGIWIYAVTMGAENYESVDFSGGTALVIGAEGEGISRLTLEKCDMAVSLPMKGALDSLNASVAAGVMMYRVLSCRMK